MWFLWLSLLAASASEFERLVEAAAARDPALDAARFEGAAARSRTTVVRRAMPAQVMVEAEGFGAPNAMEPAMGMIGVSRMWPGPGALGARGDRAGLDVELWDLELDTSRAELVTQLWVQIARIEALRAEEGLLDEQLRQARAIREVALARYAAGADVAGLRGGPMAPPPVAPTQAEGMGMGGGAAMPGMPGMGGGAAMPGMPGMGDLGATPTPPPPGMAPMPGPMAPMAMPPMDMGAMGGRGLGGVLELDAAIARLEAERDALRATLDGEALVLAVWVGEPLAEQVAAAPAGWLPSQPPALASPERARAALLTEMAAADLRVARTTNRPGYMLGAGVRMMPDGMFAGFDASVGIEIPDPRVNRGRLDAATSAVSASRARELRVERELQELTLRALATLDAATRQQTALREVAVPRAEAAWNATTAAFGAGQSGIEDALRAWAALLVAQRELVGATMQVEVARAELWRLGAR